MLKKAQELSTIVFMIPTVLRLVDFGEDKTQHTVNQNYLITNEPAFVQIEVKIHL